ncbi:hypothetical protein AVEN_150785-1 [Araneus ventricosus]|uniref:Uncharacterized protein n=1 Tax=Araneus ventricosus TaxID=182803 RepID=A0A4Y2G521_ARAVE|nr:hypothetical protein AVEN_150785-1 [Araneus ventricosus]
MLCRGKTVPASNQADMVELPSTDKTDLHHHQNAGTNYAKLQPLTVFKRGVLDCTTTNKQTEAGTPRFSINYRLSRTPTAT